MSEFEEWFKTTSAYRMLESMNYYKMDLFNWIEVRGEYRHTSVQIAFMTWVEQQAIIDDLIYKAKLRESDHQALLVKYQATKKCWEDMGKECESLKAQLNNIETCYIEKKKQVEAVSQVLCELKESLKDFQEMDLYDKGYRVTTEYVIADLEQALRGAND